jgi:hypothetical protein
VTAVKLGLFGGRAGAVHATDGMLSLMSVVLAVVMPLLLLKAARFALRVTLLMVERRTF